MARSWHTAGTGSIDRLSKLARVRQQLTADGATMISYVQSGDRLSAVTVGRRLSLHDLGAAGPVVEQVRRTRADLDVLAQPRLAGGIRAAVRSSLERSLAELDRLLVRPLAVDEPLVVLSTGVLGQLPWASLPSLHGRTLAVAPSATKWLSSRQVAPAGPRDDAGTVAGAAPGPPGPAAGPPSSRSSGRISAGVRSRRARSRPPGGARRRWRDRLRRRRPSSTPWPGRACCTSLRTACTSRRARSSRTS